MVKTVRGFKGANCLRLWGSQAVQKAVARDFQMTNVKLGRNTFRNCYSSYRVAQPTPSIDVAEETGTSKRMIDSNYNELATSDEAKLWFSINPTDAPLAKLRNYADSLKNEKN